MRSEIIKYFKNFFKGDKQSVQLKKNIISSIILKGISILISFEVVPLTINFVNPTQYGIWLTLSSLMSWFHFFDIGLTLGFRNKFAEAKARKKYKLAKIYVSTTYATLLILFGIGLGIILPLNHIVDWSSILNISQSYKNELVEVFGIMIFFFSCTMILQVFTTMIIADQRPALSSAIQVLGQAIACIVIFIMTKTVEKGNLVSLSFIFSGIPVAVLLISSILMYIFKYRVYAPSISFVKFRYIRDILGMGGKFFIITTSMLFIFQLINIIISRILGPDVVTQYNIAYKYFNIAYMITTLVLNPFWSAFTDAYTKGNIEWMKKMLKKLERAWLLSLPILIIMFICSSTFYRFWIKDAVEIPMEINITMLIYTSIIMLAAVYMNLINGIGKIQLQLYIYVIFALISYPIMSYLCGKYGIPGLLFMPTFVYFIQAIVGKLQINRILNNNAWGIWNK